MAPWVRGRGVQGKVLGLLAPALIVAAVCASCGGAVAFATAERDSPLRLASRPDSAGRVSAGGGAPPKVRDESEDDDGPIVLSSRPDSIGRVSTGGGTPNVHEDEDDDGPIVLSSRPDSVIRRRTDDVADDDNINDAHAEAPRGDDAPPQAPIDPIDADDSEDEEEDEEEEEPVRWEREVFDDVDVFEVVTFGDSETLGNLLAVGQDANARNGNGTTLLSVASAVGNLAAAELLLQAGAHVNATDLRSRNTSLHVAADRGFEEIARLLLSYGASPDIKNAEGETVRGTIQRAAQAAMAMATALPAAPSQGIPFGSLGEGGGEGAGDEDDSSEEAEAALDAARDAARMAQAASDAMGALLAAYDRGGAAAFEDPPGSWRKIASSSSSSFSGGRSHYYYHVDLQESRWETPPTCGWRESITRSGAPVYYNVVTQQVVWQKPNALRWRLVLRKGSARPEWLHIPSQHTQHDVPAELPESMVHDLMDEPNVFFFNEATGESA